jgi:uncharacterized protein (TIGR02757 family)
MASHPSPRPSRLSKGLEALVLHYDTPEALTLDPLQIVLDYAAPDQELVAWVAAALAYGRVAPMIRAIRSALAPLGPQPATWVRTHSAAQIRKMLQQALHAWVWRFHTAADLTEWVLAWKTLDARDGVESHFLPAQGEDAQRAFSRVMQDLRKALPATYGLRFSLPDPLEGSACKRWRLFLRWMVRTEWPDLGLWTRYPARDLLIPVDTHVARVARYVGLSQRSTPDGKMAQEITEALQRISPEDPLRFDFALSHLGILGDCPGVRQMPHCKPCPLQTVCRAGQKKPG